MVSNLGFNSFAQFFVIAGIVTVLGLAISIEAALNENNINGANDRFIHACLKMSNDLPRCARKRYTSFSATNHMHFGTFLKLTHHVQKLPPNGFTNAAYELAYAMERANRAGGNETTALFISILLNEYRKVEANLMASPAEPAGETTKLFARSADILPTASPKTFNNESEAGLTNSTSTDNNSGDNGDNGDSDSGIYFSNAQQKLTEAIMRDEDDDKGDVLSRDSKKAGSFQSQADQHLQNAFLEGSSLQRVIDESIASAQTKDNGEPESFLDAHPRAFDFENPSMLFEDALNEQPEQQKQAPSVTELGTSLDAMLTDAYICAETYNQLMCSMEFLVRFNLQVDSFVKYFDSVSASVDENSGNPQDSASGGLLSNTPLAMYVNSITQDEYTTLARRMLFLEFLAQQVVSDHLEIGTISEETVASARLFPSALGADSITLEGLFVAVQRSMDAVIDAASHLLLSQYRHLHYETLSRNRVRSMLEAESRTPWPSDADEEW